MPQMLSGDEPEALQAHFYQQEVNDAAGGLPINLDSLRDGPPGSKPFYPYSTLIRFVLSAYRQVTRLTRIDRYAIKGSPNQKLLLEDIYYAIESRVCHHTTIALNAFSFTRSSSVSIFQGCTKRLEGQHSQDIWIARHLMRIDRTQSGITFLSTLALRKSQDR